MAYAAHPVRSRRSLHSIGLEPLPAPLWTLVLRRLALILAAVSVAGLTATFLFLAIVPRTGLYATYTVLSGSMAPAIPTGSVVVVTAEDPSQVKVGDVITVTSEQPPYATVTHRVTRIIPTAKGPEFKTKGDANSLEDPWQFAYSGPAGKVRLAVPWLGYMLAFSATMPARFVLTGSIALLLICYFMPTIWRSASGSHRSDARPLALEN
ncbi:MAG TPA: signal peptidase I [Chloroflexota bacterium]|nr:signal peptidase I [Chloroflexota bacterium]